MCAPRALAASAPATAQPLSFPAHRRNPAPIAFPSSGGRIRSPLIYPAPPLSWYRLAILSHAGVLTTALRGVQKTNNFFKWSARDFGSNYLWHTAVDTHEEPRWESDWISPEAIKAELVGRCYNALMLLPPARRPKIWKDIINAALDGLNTKLLAFFPGPLDGFLPFSSPIQAEDALAEIRTLLRGLLQASTWHHSPSIRWCNRCTPDGRDLPTARIVK